MRTLYTFYADAARIALQSILAHKLRALLTLIGIIIGVASVVIVGAAISGLNTYVMEKITAVLGVNHFMIGRMAHEGRLSEEEWERMNRRNKILHLDDYEWVRDHCSACEEVGAQLMNQIDIKQNGEELFGVQIQGCTPNMQAIEDKTIDEGRFFLQQEYDTAAMVAVIGADVEGKVFPGSGRVREIVGGRHSIQIHAKSATREQSDAAIEDARTALRNKHKLAGGEDDDFGLVNTGEVAGEVDSFTSGIALVVVPITAISLLVGAIVVMNIMLVSVTERTFEIGLRKALGATRRQMLLQFLIESSALTTCGGILGFLLAVGVAWLITLTTGVTMTVTLFYVLLSVGVSGGIGIIAGIYPAFRASRLHPIVALARK